MDDDHAGMPAAVATSTERSIFPMGSVPHTFRVNREQGACNAPTSRPNSSAGADPGGILALGVLRDHHLDAAVAGLGREPERPGEGREKNAADENNTDGEAIGPMLPADRRGPVRILRRMWIFPLAAALVAAAFAVSLARRFAGSRRLYLAMVRGACDVRARLAGGRDRRVLRLERTLFEVWIFGAVLNVPLLAAGEIHLLKRHPVLDLVVWAALAFVVAYTIAVTRGAVVDAAALAERLPSGKEVFGDGSSAHRLPADLDPVLRDPRGRRGLVRLADARPGGAAGASSARSWSRRARRSPRPRARRSRPSGTSSRSPSHCSRGSP